MKLTVCRNCSNHILKTESACPHCGTNRLGPQVNLGRGSTVGLLLGLVTLSACGEDEKTDSAEPQEPASETAEPEPEDAPLYGAVDPG